jgi:HlyD family secretion protein
MKIGIGFVVLMLICGLVLLYKGNDAVMMGAEKKEGILTAEQVKVSFDTVSGRLLHEAVQEGQEVKKGEVLMELDSTDTDLDIEKMKAQIAQLDAQLASKSGTQQLSYAKADTDEQQDFRQIDAQRAAVASAQSKMENAQLDYDRKASLLDEGAIPQSSLDDAATALSVAQAAAAQQQQTLAKLLGGAADAGSTDSLALPAIANERMSAANITHDVASLQQQKHNLEVQLKQLEINKERLTLRAPEDGRVLKVIAKEGEMISPNTPVVLMESHRAYYDIYLSEKQTAHLQEGDGLAGHTVAGDIKVPGTIRLITQAPGFADLKNSREKGQSDLSAFQVRIYVDPTDGVRAGMTIGVNEHEFIKR